MANVDGDAGCPSMADANLWYLSAWPLRFLGAAAFRLEAPAGVATANVLSGALLSKGTISPDIGQAAARRAAPESSCRRLLCDTATANQSSSPLLSWSACGSRIASADLGAGARPWKAAVTHPSSSDEDPIMGNGNAQAKFLAQAKIASGNSKSTHQQLH